MPSNKVNNKLCCLSKFKARPTIGNKTTEQKEASYTNQDIRPLAFTRIPEIWAQSLKEIHRIITKCLQDNNITCNNTKMAYNITNINCIHTFREILF